VPIIIGPQSHVSPSSYIGIGTTPSGGFEIVRPFPIPYDGMAPQAKPKDRSEESLKRTREAMDLYRSKGGGPVGGIIFNDGEKVLHYGYFDDNTSTDPYRSIANRYSFSLLKDGEWKLLRKHDSSIGGLFTGFTVEPGKSGWLFINNGKFFFYDKLPVSY
jgi:hypothetical protein